MLGQRSHPAIPHDPGFEELARRTVDVGTGEWIDHDLTVSKVAFLQWLRANRPVVFHGSLRDIDVLKPIYVLPREAFEAEPPLFGVFDPCHLVAKGEVPVLAKIRVEPDDFPFADAIFRAGRVGELRFAFAHWRARFGARTVAAR